MEDDEIDRLVEFYKKNRSLLKEHLKKDPNASDNSEESE